VSLARLALQAKCLDLLEHHQVLCHTVHTFDLLSSRGLLLGSMVVGVRKGIGRRTTSLLGL
jgi:hypothetical protein